MIACSRLLKRIDTSLTCAGALLIIPTAMAFYAHLSFAGWVAALMLIAFALELVVTLIIAIGKSCGLLDPKLFKASSSGGLDTGFEAPTRELLPVVQKADDLAAAAGVTVANTASVRVVHVPGRGAFLYRVG